MHSVLFLVVSVLFRKPVFSGIFYASIWEGFIGSIPGAIQKSSVKRHLRSIGSNSSWPSSRSERTCSGRPNWHETGLTVWERHSQPKYSDDYSPARGRRGKPTPWWGI